MTQTPKDPTNKLESIAGGQSSHSHEGQSNDHGSERRRLLRISLTTELFKLDESEKIFSVVDLSTIGFSIRLIDEEDFLYFSVGRQVKGTLNLKRERLHVSGKVKNIRSHTVGLEFQELIPEVRQAMERALDPATLGQALKLMPTNERANWYHGSSGTDLLFWRNDKNDIQRMSLFVFGTYVQWDAEEGVSSGFSAMSDFPDEIQGVVRFETRFLEPDSAPDRAKLDVAKSLIMSSKLPVDLKNWCREKLGE